MEICQSSIKMKTKQSNIVDVKMNNDNSADDRLLLKHLAGRNLIEYPPIYSPDGEQLFIINDCTILVYSVATGEQTRQLFGAKEKIIGMQLELKQSDILVGCTIAGRVLRWSWSLGELLSSIKVNIGHGKILTFNLLDMYRSSEFCCAFVLIKQNNYINWSVVDTSSGKNLSIPLHLKLNSVDNVKATTSSNYWKYIVIAHDIHIYIIDYSVWKWRRWMSPKQEPITTVVFHPTEELIATGDVIGKIFLWRNFMDQKTVTNSLFHWHHTSITSIAFSASGSSFYSSGLEAVVVKWNLNATDVRNFMPRLSGVVCHLACSCHNIVAIGTIDNAVHFVGTNNKIQNTLQEFTYMMFDKTGRSQFPIGLRLNPRTNSLVLNGRVGHLQFYSVYSKQLLYNLDIVDQNRLSMEAGKTLYDIHVEKAAFHIDWMATGEVFNDNEHLSELRLKFWNFVEKTQSYILNTSIELPHEGSFKAIEFSHEYQVDNLVCATIGEDNLIKIWAVGDTDDIYSPGKVWYCLSETSYKNLPIEAISFSQDGSLLAAGFGNTLCIYQAENLKLKAALTNSGSVDGCIQKVTVNVAHKDLNGAKNVLIEKRKHVMQLFTKLMETNDKALLKELQHQLQKSAEKENNIYPKKLATVNDKNKIALYNKIMQMQELNLYQKLLLFQKLNIHCEVNEKLQHKVIGYLRNTIDQKNLRIKRSKLQSEISKINARERFKAKFRLQEYERRQRNYDTEITQNLIPIMSVLNLNANSKRNETHCTKSIDNCNNNDVINRILPPIQTISQITHVQFVAGEHAHLVIVCTNSRIMIWNLLTLRLQSTLKLSVNHLAFDAQTNLIAVITKAKELHIFQPNVPLPIYQRQNLPNIYGAIWLQRRYPKHRSLNVDWQSQSILYFLTEKQEISYFSTVDDISADGPPPIAFKNAASTVGVKNYTTFGTYVTKQVAKEKAKLLPSTSPLIISNKSKSAVKSLIDMSTHTMAPIHLLCNDFVQSLVKPAESQLYANESKQSKSLTNGQSDFEKDKDYKLTNGQASDTDDEDMIKTKTNIEYKREQVLRIENENVTESAKSIKEEDSIVQLKSIANQQIDFVF